MPAVGEVGEGVAASVDPLPDHRQIFGFGGAGRSAFLDADRAESFEDGGFDGGSGSGERVEDGPPGGVTSRTSQRISDRGLTVGCATPLWVMRSPLSAFAV